MPRKAPTSRPASLPSAPNDEERLLYVDPRNRLLRVSQLVAWTGLSLALFLFSLNSPLLLPFAIWVVLGLIYFGLSFAANTSWRGGFEIAEHDLQTERWSDSRPPVDVFLPNCGEPIEVLENAFRHVAELRWSGELNVFCLDDGGRQDVMDLADRYGFIFFYRPEKGWFKKAGKLRYGWEPSGGAFIAVFDADFCPRPSFLEELVPYLLEDPKVGIAQSPQFFQVRPDKNWLENGAGSVQEFFYRWVMPGRDRRQSPICVGTNAVYRRSALVETDGGALVHNSEDVHTGFDLMCVGYRTKYVPVVLATGLCPASLQTFFNQQHRWC